MNRIKRLLGVFVLTGSMFFFLSQVSAKQKKNEDVNSDVPDSIDTCSLSPLFDYVDKYSVRLDKSVPATVVLNENFTYDYAVTSKDKLEKVVVEEQIPVGTVYVSSNPEAEVIDEKVVWTLYNLEKGEVVPLQLVVKATTVSDFSSCATIVSYPEACTTTAVGTPVLAIDKTTPNEQVLINSSVPWNVVVSNNGNFCAFDVKVENTLPLGIAHESGNSSLISDIGTLSPGESREVIINTTAIEPGEHSNVVVISASNAESAQAETSILVLDQGLEVKAEGPEKQFVGKKASYEIIATNTGDILLNDLVVKNVVPSGNKLLFASDAETIEDNTITWTSSLGAGESKSFEITVLGIEGGNFCNEFEVYSASANLSNSNSICTDWGGYPALLMEVIDTEDPLLVGEETTYIVQIVNQGTAADTNVTVDVQLPDSLSVVSADGDTESTISGNSVKFAAYPVLNEKERIQFRVVAEAVDVGDSRFKVQVSSDLLKTPLPGEESTQVY